MTAHPNRKKVRQARRIETAEGVAVGREVPLAVAAAVAVAVAAVVDIVVVEVGSPSATTCRVTRNWPRKKPASIECPMMVWKAWWLLS
jgi:hypothetical protein